MTDSEDLLTQSEALAREIAAMGLRVGLPSVAAATDISSATPPCGPS